MVPMVNSLQIARTVAAAAKYPPVGVRSLGGDNFLHYGADYFEKANEDTLLLVQMEHIDGVDACADIKALDTAWSARVGVEEVTLNELLGRADFVSLNCDLNPTSYHLMGKEQFALMKPTAVVINTARGPLVEEDALIDALESGEIGGAGLDVFEDEPLSPESPLCRMENVLLSAHSANSSPTAWERVHDNTLKNLYAGLTEPQRLDA